MTRVAAATVVALVTISVPTWAHAVTRSKPPAYGPMLAGPQVAWAERRRDRGFDVKAATAGGSPLLLFSVQPPRFGTLIPELAASPSRVVVASGIGDAQVSWAQRNVYATPLGGDAKQLGSTCDLFGAADLPRAVDISGNTIVYPRCDGGGQYVHVRDYSTPTPTDVVVPGAQPGGGLRIAGRYLAWLDNGGGGLLNRTGVTVYDRLANSVAYHIAKTKVGQGVHELDLQADGKLVFSYRSPDGNRIAWASTAGPDRHTLPLHSSNPYDVRIADDRIAFQVGPEVNAGIVFPATIGITDLAGQSTKFATHAEGSLFTEDFDFDGTRVAWWSYGCSRALIHQAAASGPPHLTPARSGCRLRFTRSPRLEDNGARLHLFVNCFGFDGVGRGECDLNDTAITLTRDGKTILLGAQKRGARVNLTSKGKELLARPGPLRVRIATTLVDAAGRHERRHTHATIED